MLATQCLLTKKMDNFRVVLRRRSPAGRHCKGPRSCGDRPDWYGGSDRLCLEFAGSAVRSLTMEGE